MQNEYFNKGDLSSIERSNPVMKKLYLLVNRAYEYYSGRFL
jgi:hypothetical protein